MSTIKIQTKTTVMYNSGNTTRTFAALVLGTAIGGALGILFAPEKGSVTRRKLCGRGDDMLDTIEDKFIDFLKEMKNDVAMAKDNANDLIEKGRIKMSN